MQEPQKSKFIFRVQRHPLLYNQNHIDYNEHFKKDEIWERVAREFSMPNGGAAKLQWKRLRDKFRESLKKKISPQRRRSANALLEYNFQRQMSFLIPFTVVGRGDTFYIPINGTENYYEREHFLHNSSHDNLREDFEQYAARKSSRKKIKVAPWLSQTFIDNKRLFNKQQNKILENSNQKTQREEYKRLKAERFSCKMDEFFRKMCETTKTLPELQQLKVKKKLFDMVIDAEEYFNHSMTHNNQTSKRQTKAVKMKNHINRNNASLMFLDESENVLNFHKDFNHLHEDFLDRKISQIEIGDDVDDVDYFKYLLPYVKQLPLSRKLILRTEFENKIVTELETSELNKL